MKLNPKNNVIAGVALVASLASGSAFAEITANVAATSNYLWRGLTQSADISAVSGGVDYTQDSGFYAGGWTSSTSGGQYELDLYAGYRGEHKAIKFDVGAIQYRYPVGSNNKLDFMELQGKVMYQMYTFSLATTLSHEDSAMDAGNTYMSASAEKEYSGMMMTATIGRHSGDDLKNDGAIGDDYIHYGVTANKDNVTLGISKNNLSNINGAGDLRFTVTWGMEIDVMK